MNLRILHDLTRFLFVGLVGLLISALPVHAHSYLSGTYHCVKVEIAGKIQPCSVPSIELNSDGSYQILAERGTYEIIGGRWLALSSSKDHGKALLDQRGEIIFEFLSGGRKSRITYRENYQRPPGWDSI